MSADLPQAPDGTTPRAGERPDEAGMRIAATPGMQRSAAPAVGHSLVEDTIALFIGTLLMALGIAMFKNASLVTGGTAGLAFLLHYTSGMAFGPAFFLINLPFYWLAWRQLGREFTVKTFAAVLLLAGMSELVPTLVGFSYLQPLFAAVCGGLLTGVGLLILFRHRASVGGLGIAAVALQERLGWRAGKVQMAADVVILTLSLAVIALPQVLLSIAGALTLNLVLAINHRPGRYIGH